MSDIKKSKPVLSSTTAVSGTIGALPSVGADGLITSLTTSQSGVLFTSITNSDGTAELSIETDNAPITGTGALMVGARYIAPLPTYGSGDAAFLHVDARGRLLVSQGEIGQTVDVEADNAAGPAAPVGSFHVGLSRALGSLPAYTDGDACVFNFDGRGRLLVSPGDGATTIDVGTDDSAAPANPIGNFSIAKFTTAFPTLANGDATVLHTDSSGRLLVSQGTGADTASVGTDDSAAPANPLGNFPLAKFTAALPTLTNGDATVLHTDSNGRLRVVLTSTVGSDIDVDTDNSPTTNANPVGLYNLSVVDDGALAAYTDGDAATFRSDLNGRLFVTLVDPSNGDTPDITQDDDAAPANPIGTWPMTLVDAVLPTLTDADATVLRTNTSGQLHTVQELGQTLHFDADGDNTAQVLKASAGRLYNLHVYNSNAADAFVQLFDLASGGVTVGTTTPDYVVFVPGGGAAAVDFNPIGLDFGTAITYACTTGPTNSTDPTTGLTVSGGYV